MFLRLIQRSESGMTLIEVLLAVMMLVMVVAPVLELQNPRNYIYPFLKETALALATSDIENAGQQMYRSKSWPGDSVSEEQVGDLYFSVTRTVEPVTMGTGEQLLRRVSVTVTCENCPHGAHAEVKVVALLAKM